MSVHQQGVICPSQHFSSSPFQEITLISQYNYHSPLPYLARPWGIDLACDIEAQQQNEIVVFYLRKYPWNWGSCFRLHNQKTATNNILLERTGMEGSTAEACITHVRLGKSIQSTTIHVGLR